MNLLFLFWCVLLVIKLTLNLFIPLAPDEAYYWVWSQYPAWSYFDHPGMVSWLFWLGHPLSFLPQGERIPAILLNHCTLLLWYLILRHLWSEEMNWKWLLLFIASPFLGLGSLLVTPDLPLLFFWALSLYFFIQLLKSDHWIFAICLGLSLGFGFCSKYHIVLFLPAALAYLTFEKRWKKIRLSHIALVVIGGLVASSPVIYWNSEHHWVSFLFQLRHGLGKGEWQWHWTTDYLLGQIFIFFPSLLFLFFKGWKFRQLRLFFWFAFIPWITFFLTSFRGAVQANWPIISYAPALVLVIASHRSWKHLKGVIIFWIVLCTSLLFAWIFPISDELPEKLREVHQIRDAIPDLDSFEPLYAGSYQIASELWYYRKTPTFKLRGMSRVDFFDFLNESVPSNPEFYLLRESEEPLPDWLEARQGHVEIVRQFDRYELLRVSP